MTIKFSNRIKLSLRPGVAAQTLLAALNVAPSAGTEDLIEGYYIGDEGEPKVYLSFPGNPIQTAKNLEALNNQLEYNKNYRFKIKKSAFASFANNIIQGVPATDNDLLEYDKKYLQDLEGKSLSTLKTVTASGWAGDFVWAALSFPLDLGVKLAQDTQHLAAMSATQLGMTIAFPFMLGPLVGYTHYRSQIADYEAKYGVTPPPNMLRKIKHQSQALAFQVCCAVGGWTLAYELAVPTVDALIGLLEMSALGSTPAYWVTVIAVGLLTALFVVVASAITQHYLRKNNSEGETKTNYLRLALCAFAAGSLFMLCFAVPGQLGIKKYLLDEIGLEWSKIICGLISALLIGTSVTAASACYHYKKNVESLKNDPWSNLSAIKGFFGGDPQPTHGPRLAL